MGPRGAKNKNKVVTKRHKWNLDVGGRTMWSRILGVCVATEGLWIGEWIY
jgi:hypothetical protein